MTKENRFEGNVTVTGISEGQSESRNGLNTITTRTYIELDGKKYGPVLYDSGISNTIEVGKKLDLAMYKWKKNWLIASAKTQEGKVHVARTKGMGLSIFLNASLFGGAGSVLFGVAIITFIAQSNIRPDDGLMPGFISWLILSALSFGFFLKKDFGDLKQIVELSKKFGDDIIH